MASNTPAPKTGDWLSSMTKLSPTVFIYRPSETSSPPAAPPYSKTSAAVAVAAPKLILLCTWMAARDAPIAKYVAGYQRLFPSSQILLVRCEARNIFSARTTERDLQPAISVLRSVLTLPDANTAGGGGAGPGAGPGSGGSGSSSGRPDLHVHIFSNGGSAVLSTLYAALRPSTLPPHTTVFDSTPGAWTYGRSISALTASMPPSRPLRLLLVPIAHAVSVVYWLLYASTLSRLLGSMLRGWRRRTARGGGGGGGGGAGDEEEEEEQHGGALFVSPMAQQSASHNDRRRNAAEVRRTYVYSEEDPLIGWRHLEAHADEAERRGFAVRREKFVGSQHVAHVRVDEERYWRVVRETWDGPGAVV